MDALDRRAILTAAVALGLASSPASVIAQDDSAPDQDDHIFNEDQQGDPLSSLETLLYNPIAIQKAVFVTHKASFQPRVDDFGARLLAEVRNQYLGKSRANAHDTVQSFFSLFDLPFASGGKPLPFCAAGLSYVSTTVYAKAAGAGDTSTTTLRSALGDLDHHHFYPTPSVANMVSVARGKLRWVDRSAAVGALKPRPGWLIVYDWARDGRPDHVGIVESATPTMVKTLEFNTTVKTSGSAINGGAIAEKQRPFNNQVLGFIRTDLKRLV